MEKSKNRFPTTPKWYKYLPSSTPVWCCCVSLPWLLLLLFCCHLHLPLPIWCSFFHPTLAIGLIPTHDGRGGCHRAAWMWINHDDVSEGKWCQVRVRASKVTKELLKRGAFWCYWKYLPKNVSRWGFFCLSRNFLPNVYRKEFLSLDSIY